MKEILLTFLFAIFQDREKPIYFRTFLPKEATGKLWSPPHKITATINQLDNDRSILAELKELNKRQGIYFVVNSGGHTDAEITKFTALFIENDELSIPEQHNLLDASPLKPSMRVVTKRSVHAYLLLDGTTSEEEWRNGQERLINYFKSDASIKNLSRLMRPPGFDHVSVVNAQLVCTPVTADLTHRDARYTINAIFGNFPSKADTTLLGRKISTSIPKKIKEGSRNTTLTSIAGTLHHRGLSTKAIEAALISENSQRCDPPLSLTEVRSIVDSVTSYPTPVKDREYSIGTGNTALGPLTVHRLDQIKTEIIPWLWDSFIPFGEFVLLDGEEGIGKSTVVLGLAAVLGNGKGIRTISDFEFVEIEPGRTLILSAEDSLGHVLKPRLVALKAELGMISAIDEPFSFDPHGLRRLEDAIALNNPKLVIIDPLFSYAGRTNLNNDNEIRSITRELSKIAHLFGCTILGVRHINKSKGMGSPRAAGLNGVGWRASARSALIVGRSETTGETAIIQHKTNLSRRDERAWGFIIKSATILGDDGTPIETSTLEWTGLSSLTCKDMLGPAQDGEKLDEISDAMEFLYEALSEGERAVQDIIAEGKAFGISEKQIRTARRNLEIRSGNGTIRKEGFGKAARTFIRLPIIHAPKDESGQVCLDSDTIPNNINGLPIPAQSDPEG